MQTVNTAPNAVTEINQSIRGRMMEIIDHASSARGDLERIEVAIVGPKPAEVAAPSPAPDGMPSVEHMLSELLDIVRESARLASNISEWI